ncbi:MULTISPECIES: ABC transporter ATP-binding protein [Agrobacterium]|uniref:ABC transporter ATP-binding protein n=1 Tax=Agrobacterium rosae TaxID=1972867 RepID=A0A1R3TNH7_9HYPH|nr:MULTISPECIES: ABC transporter ATP-binding protein [Agrobacterium]MDX8314189.1 ABC transporter ATP-binding protein [Agrobacterium rosae]MDX8331092.1 ABC transporter ATP-binding protein [Agrobacterium rosae]SCX24321.1 LIV-I protein F [Agrobacterium rosae]SCX24913.1 LIV-I protein F [Agrobacterium sp. DSM 25558]
MLLEVSGLHVRYGRNHAVKALDLTIQEGEIVTVLGSNGAGKTSLLRALQGAVKPAGGSVKFAGEDITNFSPADRVTRGMMLVPEGRQIFVSMTVHENLLMGAYLRHDGDWHRDLQAVYQRFPNLSERKDMKASVLSGGEQQMLAIGRALVARPRLIMLDEPSLGLSPLFVNNLFELIKELNRDGISILLVEQNTGMALETASRGYVLELGKVVLADSAAALAGNTALTEAYLGGSHASSTSPRQTQTV